MCDLQPLSRPFAVALRCYYSPRLSFPKASFCFLLADAAGGTAIAALQRGNDHIFSNDLKNSRSHVVL